MFKRNFHNKQLQIRPMFHGMVVDTIDEWLRDAPDDIVRNAGAPWYPDAHSASETILPGEELPPNHTEPRRTSFPFVRYIINTFNVCVPVNRIRRRHGGKHDRKV